MTQSKKSVFGKELRKQFLLDEKYRNLNHGEINIYFSYHLSRKSCFGVRLVGSTPDCGVSMSILYTHVHSLAGRQMLWRHLKLFNIVLSFIFSNCWTWMFILTDIHQGRLALILAPSATSFALSRNKLKRDLTASFATCVTPTSIH